MWCCSLFRLYFPPPGLLTTISVAVSPNFLFFLPCHPHLMYLLFLSPWRAHSHLKINSQLEPTLHPAVTPHPPAPVLLLHPPNCTSNLTYHLLPPAPVCGSLVTLPPSWPCSSQAPESSLKMQSWSCPTWPERLRHPVADEIGPCQHHAPRGCPFRTRIHPTQSHHALCPLSASSPGRLSLLGSQLRGACGHPALSPGALSTVVITEVIQVIQCQPHRPRAGTRAGLFVPAPAALSQGLAPDIDKYVDSDQSLKRKYIRWPLKWWWWSGHEITGSDLFFVLLCLEEQGNDFHLVRPRRCWGPAPSLPAGGPGLSMALPPLSPQARRAMQQS